MLVNCAHIICYSKITLQQRNEDYLYGLIGSCFFWKTLKRKKSGGKIKNQGRNGGWRGLIKSLSAYSRVISIHSKADYDQLLDTTTVRNTIYIYFFRTIRTRVSYTFYVNYNIERSCWGLINHIFYVLVIHLIRSLSKKAVTSCQNVLN